MWSDGLDGQTLRIAGSSSRILKIVAGPGTGKTFSLMRRVARLIEEGADPRRILLCTFTRTAALDLERSLNALGTPNSEQVRAGTLHSLCFGILGSSAFFETTDRTPRPLMQFEQRFLVEDLTGAPVGGVRNVEKRLKAFDAAWARLQHEEPGWPVDELDRAFSNRLEAWLRFHNAILIGELVARTLTFVRANPLSLDVPVFEHVVIDEYQDLNKAEQELVSAFAANASLTIVGDEDQSIYSFKHAHPEGMSEFAIRHPGAVEEQLIECRRCPECIIRAANTLISNNPTRQNRVLVPLDGAAQGTIRLLQWPSSSMRRAASRRF